MSKRKVVAGGYEDSTDGSEPESTNLGHSTKKPRPFSTLRRLSSTPNLQQRGFQMPIQRRPPFGLSLSSSGQVGSLRAASVSASATPNVSAPGTPQESSPPMLFNGITASLKQEGPSSQSIGQHLVDTKGKRPTLTLHTNTPVPLQARSTMALERQVNELSLKLEEYRETSTLHNRLTDEKLTKVLEAVHKLATNSLSAHGPSSGAASPNTLDSSAVPGLQDPSIYLTNPVPSSDLRDTVSRACNAKAVRPDLEGLDNLVKEHMRKAFLDILEIHQLDEIGPYYEDEHGRPDPLPVQFIDPDSGYCKPRPHWDASLADQVGWIPTYMHRVRATILPDGSKLSEVLKRLTDFDMIYLLKHGPFGTARSSWRTLRKTAPEQKAFSRTQYIRTVRALRGSDFEFMTHREYMSDEEEIDGITCVKRPSHRPAWVNNMFDGIRVAVASTRPTSSSSTTPMPRSVLVVDLPLPLLERGSGSKKVVLQIPECAVSRGWRKQFPDEFKKATQEGLINDKVKVKPDISAFLAQNPIAGSSEPSDHGVRVKVEKVKKLAQHIENVNDIDRRISEDDEQGSMDEQGEYDGAHGIRAQSHDLVEPGTDNQQPPAGFSGSANPAQAIGQSSRNDAVEFPIDPQLLDDGNQDFNADLPCVVHPPPPPSMPPPPPIQPGVEAGQALAHVAEENVDPPKRRGRPKGSKNKPKPVYTS